MYYLVLVSWAHLAVRTSSSSLEHSILLAANTGDLLHKNEPTPFLVETYINNVNDGRFSVRETNTTRRETMCFYFDCSTNPNTNNTKMQTN